MKKTNKRLSLMLITAVLCLSLAACSSEGEGEESTSPEGDMPQISVDLSETAQTTPENTLENAPENTPDSVSENTSETAETSVPETEETTPAENPETSIIDTEITTEPAPETTSETAPEVTYAPVLSGENSIVDTAVSLIGKPFFFGGADPDTGFDNSGLMHYVLRANGIDCPRLTGDIADWGEKLTYEELQPGDLVFFEYEGSGKADFGGIYIGGGEMIVSTDEDRPVSRVDISTAYYQRTFQFGIKTQ